MSTIKDEIWEEKNSIEPPKKSANNGEFEECGITIDTNDKSEKKILNDTTKTKMSGIYKIVNKVNGKYYVGSSVKICGNVKGTRWKRHIWNLNNNNHHNIHLQHAWNKYGFENFQFVIVEILNDITIKEILSVEQKYLDIAKTEQDKCYNLNFEARGGDWSDDSRKRFSIKRMGKGNPMYGKKVSDNRRNQISNSLKGKNSGLNNPRSDKNTYKFYNVIFDKIFIGTQYDFYCYNGFRVSSLITKSQNKLRGWILDVS